MAVPNPYESPLVPCGKPVRPSGAILPALGFLACTVLAMYSGKLCWWAIDYRMSNTPFMAKLPEPSIPLWIIDCIWTVSLAGTFILVCLSFAAAYRTFQRMFNFIES